MTHLTQRKKPVDFIPTGVVGQVVDQLFSHFFGGSHISPPEIQLSGLHPFSGDMFEQHIVHYSGLIKIDTLSGAIIDNLAHQASTSQAHNCKSTI